MKTPNIQSPGHTAKPPVTAVPQAVPATGTLPPTNTTKAGAPAADAGGTAPAVLSAANKPAAPAVAASPRSDGKSSS